MKNFSLLTKRLAVRELTLTDAPFILRLLNEPSFIENIADKGVRCVGGAKKYLIEGPLASYTQHSFGLFRVALQEDDTPIGIAGLLKRDFLDDVDLGYAMLPEFCGLGYAFEVTAALLQYAKDKLALKSLVAIVAKDNHRSIKLLLKLGFRADGTVGYPADKEELSLYRIDLTRNPQNICLNIPCIVNSHNMLYNMAEVNTRGRFLKWAFTLCAGSTTQVHYRKLAPNGLRKPKIW